MQKSFRVVILLALIGLGIYGWRILFPSPEHVIRSRVAGLARTVSFEPKDGTVPKGFKLQKFPDYFTPDLVINVTVRGYGSVNLEGRDELVQRVMLAMKELRGLQVEFLDVTVTLRPDRQSALANLTVKATIAGEQDFIVQECNFTFRNSEGRWLICRIDSVKSLSRVDSRLRGARPLRSAWCSRPC
jgi:hypothetical protein